MYLFTPIWVTRITITKGVVAIYHRHPSGRTMGMGLTEILTQLSTSKGGRCLELSSLPASWVNCLEILQLQKPGALRACPGRYRGCFTLCKWRVDVSSVIVATAEGYRFVERQKLKIRTALFWGITQSVVIISHLRVKHPWPLNVGPLGCPETLIRNYYYCMLNGPESSCSLLLRGGSLTSSRS